MPEGDTIHRAARAIGAVLTGRSAQEVRAPRFAAWPERLTGRAVHSVDAHGKHLFIRFDGALTLHSHLRMTGAWDVHAAGERWRRAARRAWLFLGVDGSEVVQFDGPVLELVPDARTRRLGLGPDVLGPSFDAGVALRRLRARGGEIGDALLDQRALAGIGNVWKCEACFAARVDPWADVASVADADALALLAFAREGMQASVGGAPRPGAVHARAGLPCPVCATQIRVRGQGDGARATFWCPGCQGSEAGGRAPRASPEPRRQ